MFKKKLMFLLMIGLLIFGGGVSFFNLAHADDDRDEEEYDEDDEDDDEDEDEDEKDEPVKTKTYEETVVVEPARIVTENQLQTITLSDRDHDGIPDDEDKHPDIAEIYIVADDNLNGIVDTFEYEK